jgi:cellobiose phosphorylase
MAAAINAHAWDGRWYLCALDDDGQPIGSRHNEEGRIFLNMQSWAQLGRVADDDRFKAAWAACREHLDSGWGLMLNWPTYTKPQANVGRLSYLRPGICENGSVYTHGNAFMILALLERGMADDALRVWQDIAPGNLARPTATQPNIFANGYFGPDNDIEVGRAEHMWVTGSASWMFMLMVEHMLGLRRGYDGLRVQPCLPSTWDKAAITRTYRGTTYRVSIVNPGRVQAAAVRSVTVDGREHPIGAVLPLDGGEHDVRVVLAG